MSLPVSFATTSPQVSVVVGGQQPIQISQPASQPLTLSADAAPVLRVSPPDKPRGMVCLHSVKSSGSVTISGLTTSGYLTIRWWDGVVQIAGPFNGTTPMTASRTIPSTGNWSGASPKTIYAWSGNRSQSGQITSISCVSGGLYAADFTNCESLTSADVSNNSLASLLLDRCPALRLLYCHTNELPELELGSLSLLQELYCHANRLTALKLPLSLLSVQCNDNLIQTLSLAGLSSLVNLYCHYNQLTTLDLRPSPSLKNFNCLGNRLTSVRATGLALNGVVGGSLGQNLLSGPALDAFYHDLAVAPGGKLYVTGNPGVNSDNPQIATAKGYQVYGT